MYRSALLGHFGGILPHELDEHRVHVVENKFADVRPSTSSQTRPRASRLDVEIVHGGHFPSFGRTRYRQIIDEYLASKRKPGCYVV